MNINELGFESWGRRTRVALVVAISLISFLGLCLAAPIPLGPSYHIFADNRTQLGIPNCLDVLSNIPFMVVGRSGFSVSAIVFDSVPQSRTLSTGPL